MTTAPGREPTASAAGIDPKNFRDLMSRVCAPVTIVTTATTTALMELLPARSPRCRRTRR